MLPSAEQTTSIALGLTMGDATEAPTVNTNHAKTRRISIEEVRKPFIARDYYITAVLCERRRCAM